MSGHSHDDQLPCWYELIMPIVFFVNGAILYGVLWLIGHTLALVYIRFAEDDSDAPLGTWLAILAALFPILLAVIYIYGNARIADWTSTVAKGSFILIGGASLGAITSVGKQNP